MRRVVALGSMGVALAFAQPSSAQPAQPQQSQGASRPPVGDASTAAAARAAFERGVQALEDSQFADAAAAFEESFRRNPLPVVLFNLGFAYRGLGRNQDAIAALERFLSDPGASEAEMIQTGRDERDRLRATLARLTVRATPAAAVVLVDGRRPTRDGDALVVDPGRRVIEVTLDGYRPHREERTLAPGARDTAEVTLAVIDDAGRLRIEPSVANASVTIDGVFAGTGLVERPARMGTHRVVISAEGYLPLERTVRVGGTGLVRVDATLQRPRANPWPWLGPTIGVLGAAAIGFTAWGIAEATRGESLPNPVNCWNCLNLTGAR